MSLEYYYNGDYEDLIDWITDTYPPNQYNTFNSWLSDVKLDFISSNHHFSDDIREEMLQFWKDNNLGELDTKQKMLEVRQRNTTYNRVSDLGTFRLQDAYNTNTDRPKASIRRELQELVKEGKIERVRKGVYRIR